MRIQTIRALAMLAVCLGCVAATAAPATVPQLRIAAARAVADTGVIEHLAGKFRERNPGIAIRILAVGALTALEYGRAGKADLVVTHYPPEEVRFVTLGHGTERVQFMYSQYAVFGPGDDALGIGRATDFGQVLRRLMEAEADMLVPSPRSGTYRKLEELWASAGLSPDWITYQNTGSSAAATLLQAADLGAYCFADMGLYLVNRERLAATIRPLYREDISFKNEISALVVNAATIPGVHQALAERFLDFLVSAPGQQAVTDFNAARFGVALYIPSAHEDPYVINRTMQARLVEETRRRELAIGTGVVVALLILTSLGLVIRNHRLERRNWQRALELEQAGHARAMAEKADRAKSRFLATMSHEIRTPLNAILGLAQLGLRQSGEDPSRDSFRHIYDSGRHLLGVINDILDFSKIEAGKFSIEPRAFHLVDLVESTAGLLSDRARNRNIEFRISLGADLPAWVEGDPLRVQQILLNLLANAIKFTARGGVSVAVTHDGRIARFRVSDTGIGMSDEVLARLFTPYEQAGSSTTRHYGGTGLGLAISQNLARLMHGVISVTSKPGAGSCFTLEVPLPVVPPPAAAPAAAPPGTGPQLHGLRILAAEDMDINRYLLKTILEQEGAGVEFAENGQQAVARLEAREKPGFDVVLMDVRMPVMDGLDATRRILEISPELPVIALTAHALAEEREQALAAGMVDHVTKPVDPHALIAAIRRHARARPAAGQPPDAG